MICFICGKETEKPENYAHLACCIAYDDWKKLKLREHKELEDNQPIAFLKKMEKEKKDFFKIN